LRLLAKDAIRRLAIHSYAVWQSIQELLDNGDRWADLSILSSLLKRNAKQHRRTNYFQRLQAVERCAKLFLRLRICNRYRDIASTLQRSVDTPEPIRASHHFLCQYRLTLQFPVKAFFLRGQISSSKTAIVPL
jgi:hypothetical protein